MTDGATPQLETNPETDMTNTSGFSSMKEILEFVFAHGYSYSSTIAPDGSSTQSFIAPRKESASFGELWSEYLKTQREEEIDNDAEAE